MFASTLPRHTGQSLRGGHEAAAERMQDLVGPRAGDRLLVGEHGLGELACREAGLVRVGLAQLAVDEHAVEIAAAIVREAADERDAGERRRPLHAGVLTEIDLGRGLVRGQHRGLVVLRERLAVRSLRIAGLRLARVGLRVGLALRRRAPLVAAAQREHQQHAYRPRRRDVVRMARRWGRDHRSRPEGGLVWIASRAETERGGVSAMPSGPI